MCQSVWWDPATWGCQVTSAYSGMSSAFSKGLVGPFIHSLLQLMFAFFDIVVYAILDGITSLIDGEIVTITNLSEGLGPFSLPVYVGLFTGFFAILYLLTGIMKNVPVLDVVA